MTLFYSFFNTSLIIFTLALLSLIFKNNVNIDFSNEQVESEALVTLFVLEMLVANTMSAVFNDKHHNKQHWVIEQSLKY